MLNHVNRCCCSILIAVFGCAAITSAADVLVLKGKDIGTFRIVGQATLPDGDVAVITSDFAFGESTHLGRYALQAGETIDTTALAKTGKTVISDGHFTITAANGDSLTGTYAGTGQCLTSVCTLVEYEVSGPITAGTGRFAGGTGTFGFLGSADLTAGTFADSIFGAVTK